ncbi:MAG: hypothetical protein GX620_11725 [Chloroflexi bacterium]|nr:hypothetical protein [Chloroflexota bacterium]
MSRNLAILEKVEAGEIDVAEAVRLIGSDTLDERSSELSGDPVLSNDALRRLPRQAQVAWWAALGLGSALIAISGAMLWAAYLAGAGLGWALAGWMVFVTSVGLLIGGWWLRQANWARLRVHYSGRLITIAVPVPLTALAQRSRSPARRVPDNRHRPVPGNSSVSGEDWNGRTHPETGLSLWTGGAPGASHDWRTDDNK